MGEFEAVLGKARPLFLSCQSSQIALGSAILKYASAVTAIASADSCWPVSVAHSASSASASSAPSPAATA